MQVYLLHLDETYLEITRGMFSEEEDKFEAEMMDGSDLSICKTSAYNRLFNLENWIIINQLFMTV